MGQEARRIVEKPHKELASLLLDKGAAVDPKDNDGSTPLRDLIAGPNCSGVLPSLSFGSTASPLLRRRDANSL
jgi:hypothetical protein